MPIPIGYHFSQRFAFPAEKIFEWCTDFDPKDHALMGDKSAKRQITRITDTTIMLKDTFYSSVEAVEKEKLVQLYPKKLFWVSTHLTGPNKYSQFLYQISPHGKSASVLHFTGLHLEYTGKALNKADAKLLANRLHREDAGAWKLLAKAMGKELRK